MKKTTLTLCLLALPCSLVVGSSASAQTPATSKSAPLKTGAQAGKTSKKKRTDADRAKDAVLGYYNALITQDYDAAGTFVHPDMIDTIRNPLTQQLEKSAPANQKATLRALSVQSRAELKNLSNSKFFAHFLRSRYGGPIAFVGDPALKTSVDITEVKCTPETRVCLVLIKLSANGKGGKRFDDFTTMGVERVDGRWLVGKTPPAPPKKPGGKSAKE